jgi:cell division protein FtsI (penicillin-binding protein 3)
MRSRIVLILIVLTCMWSILIARAAYLQLIPDYRLQSLQHRQFETVVTLKARRGDVVDRNGRELAVSMTSYSLFADPKLIEDQRKVVKILATELKIAPKAVLEKIRGKKKRFVWIERHIDRDIRDSIEAQLKAAKIRGMGWVQESKRIYPNDRLLSHVLGFVGGEENGLEGLELKYNDKLQADNKKVSMRKDARGRPLLVAGQMFSEAPEGSDIQLTIDRELQFTLEQELAGAVVEHQADAAVGVILDAKTSEILAMASSPSFDPNKPQGFSFDKKRNRSITDSFEPGSTMKTFIIAGALGKKFVQPNTKIDCEGGEFRIGKRVIHEADSKHKFNMLTVSEVLLHSSNVGMAKIGLKMGEQEVAETLRNFGFGDRTGVDLPGEARGIVQPLPWKEHLLANIAFGHGVATTPLQMANAYASIANGGFLKTPYIVKSIHDPETGETVESQPRTLRRVLSEEDASKMRFMLSGATTGDGTGVNARVAGYPVAGKTGTAQKINPNGRGYMPGGYVSSFAGFLPANDPKWVIYIAVDRPRKGYYGAEVAAPVFSRVAQFAIRHAGLAPVFVSANNMIKQGIESAKPKEVPKAIDLEAGVPDLAGMTLREVLTRVTGTGIDVKVQGDGIVTRTEPAAGSSFASSKELTVYLSK